MKKILNEWRKHLKEARFVPGETTPAQLRDDPALSGYRSGEKKTVDIPADYDKEEAGETEELSLLDQGKKYFTKLIEKANADDPEAAEVLDNLADWLSEDENAGDYITLRHLY
tara:strand:- start:131 stop:469 length:339 start_codon:yes stop_codon:yes gene_type:complete